MTRTMVYLQEEVHRRLKHLAVEQHTSLAALIREAVEALYREDMADLRIGRQRLSEYLRNPTRATSYTEYRAHRAKR